MIKDLVNVVIFTTFPYLATVSRITDSIIANVEEKARGKKSATLSMADFGLANLY